MRFVAHGEMVHGAVVVVVESPSLAVPVPARSRASRAEGEDLVVRNAGVVQGQTVGVVDAPTVSVEIVGAGAGLDGVAADASARDLRVHLGADPPAVVVVVVGVEG